MGEAGHEEESSRRRRGLHDHRGSGDPAHRRTDLLGCLVDLVAAVDAVVIVRLLLLFWLGAAIGSFGHALSWRLRHSYSLVKGRSMCERCQHQLGAIDLVPIISWLLLRGRCRYCRGAIALRHPVVEAGVGVLAVLSYLSYHWLAR
ncbi:MAG: hypothetical protein GEV03_25750 [Streptosporangiales bacterium]|nr:hypothetical protein [Streptosporangiales bacterium]